MMALPLSKLWIEPGDTLPKAPKKTPARALQALSLYDRIELRPSYPAVDARRRVLTGRLDDLLRAMNPRELAAYYAGLVARRG
jgi:hypothetical protein